MARWPAPRCTPAAVLPACRQAEGHVLGLGQPAGNLAGGNLCLLPSLLCLQPTPASHSCPPLAVADTHPHHGALHSSPPVPLQNSSPPARCQTPPASGGALARVHPRRSRAWAQRQRARQRLHPKAATAVCPQGPTAACPAQRLQLLAWPWTAQDILMAFEAEAARAPPARLPHVPQVLVPAPRPTCLPCPQPAACHLAF